MEHRRGEGVRVVMCQKCKESRSALEVREVDAAEREVIDTATGEVIGRMILRPPNWQFPDEPSRWSAHHREDAYSDNGIRYATPDEALDAIAKRVWMYRRGDAWDQDAWEERSRRSMVIYD